MGGGVGEVRVAGGLGLDHDGEADEGDEADAGEGKLADGQVSWVARFFFSCIDFAGVGLGR